jgi:hypothetical protein
MPTSVAGLARHLVLGALLEDLTERYGAYELVAHWTQGEFHHDVVLRLPEAAASDLPGRVLVVATNCNGGIKEVLSLPKCPTAARSGTTAVRRCASSRAPSFRSSSAP